MKKKRRKLQMYDLSSCLICRHHKGCICKGLNQAIFSDVTLTQFKTMQVIIKHQAKI
jgi:hypothetical protein